MNILVVLSKDGPNLFIENIVRMLEKRHSLRIFATYTDDNSLRMFSDLKTTISPFSACDDTDYKWADCIFAPVQPLSEVMHQDKYIFSFCNMNPLFDIVKGYDFVFTLNSPQNQLIQHYASMPIGNPKNDRPQVVEEQLAKKRFLFIDSGHFPFGKKGKEQVAEMLLKICSAYPDYELCIKPRWLSGNSFSSMTHPNAIHIYDILHNLCSGELPENLILLQEHRDMQELIDESSCVITLCSTAYLDVAMRGKPLVIVDGLDNEDMYQVRNYYFDDLYEKARATGCVVNYKDVLSVLPDGRFCDEKFINSVFSHQEGASQRAVEIIEYIYETYLKKGKYPPVKDYTYETYRNEMDGSESIDMKTIWRNRYFSATGNCLAQNASISNNLPWREFELRRMELCQHCGISKEDYNKLRDELTKLKAEFLISHSDFAENDVDQSYLYAAMYKKGEFEKILKLAEQTGQSHESINFYAGMIYHGDGQFELAEKYLMKYIEESYPRTYPKYMIDMISFRLNAYLYLAEQLKRAKKTETLLMVIDQVMNCFNDYPEKGKGIKDVLRKAGFVATVRWFISKQGDKKALYRVLRS